FVENKYALRDGAVETDYVDGCVIFFRAIVAEKTGLFEPLFFLDYEEIDWCFRVKKSGFKLLIIPAAKVWHKIRKSFGGKGPLFYYFFIRGRLLWAGRNLSLSQQWHEYRLIACEFLPFLFYTRKYPAIKRAYWDLLLMMRERSILEAKLFGIRDFIFRRFGDCPARIRRLNEKYFEKK
ncbi:MAG: hypothetical protein PHV55_03555, partial [Candidatus Omnitrophica bacterium]|nr:hypothetical protein [Candidatus Omnitrophota bacterium]